jgi:hypothetical protein
MGCAPKTDVRITPCLVLGPSPLNLHDDGGDLHPFNLPLASTLSLAPGSVGTPASPPGSMSTPAFPPVSGGPPMLLPGSVNSRALHPGSLSTSAFPPGSLTGGDLAAPCSCVSVAISALLSAHPSVWKVARKLSRSRATVWMVGWWIPAHDVIAIWSRSLHGFLDEPPLQNVYFGLEPPGEAVP